MTEAVPLDSQCHPMTTVSLGGYSTVTFDSRFCIQRPFSYRLQLSFISQYVAGSTCWRSTVPPLMEPMNGGSLFFAKLSQKRKSRRFQTTGRTCVPLPSASSVLSISTSIFSHDVQVRSVCSSCASSSLKKGLLSSRSPGSIQFSG